VVRLRGQTSSSSGLMRMFCGGCMNLTISFTDPKFPGVVHEPIGSSSSFVLDLSPEDEDEQMPAQWVVCFLFASTPKRLEQLIPCHSSPVREDILN